MLSEGSAVLLSRHSASLASEPEFFGSGRTFTDMTACPSLDTPIDQWVPPSGYVDSGTSQSASRTYAIAGQKTLQILAQNDQGTRSDWTPYTFTCNEQQQQCPIGYVLQGTACVFNECPVGYLHQGSACIFSECPAGYVLLGSQCVLANGSCTTPNYCSGKDLLDGCTDEVLQTCEWGCFTGRCNDVPAPVATLKAIPSLVHQGDTTKVTWTSNNVTSCSVTSTNDDSWSTLTGTNESSNPSPHRPLSPCTAMATQERIPALSPRASL